MRFNNVIRDLLGDRVQIEALKCLYHHEEGLTGRALAGLVGTSTFKISQVLSILSSQGLVHKSVVGKANRYRLNQKSILTTNIVVPLIEFEKKLFSQLGQKIASVLEIKPVSIILYGSFARGEEEPDSDMDLMLVYEDGTEKHSVKEVAELVGSVIQEVYGNPVSISRCLKSGFKVSLKEGDSRIKDIIKEGKVIFGASISEILDNAREKN